LAAHAGRQDTVDVRGQWDAIGWMMGGRTAASLVFLKIVCAADRVAGVVIARLSTPEEWFLLERHGIGKAFIAACAQAWKGHCEEAAIRIF